jgi:hypothetical protein
MAGLDPAIHPFAKTLTKMMDPRVISASTRVFDALLPAGDGSSRSSFSPASCPASRPPVAPPDIAARGERLRYTDKFDDPNLPGEIKVTVALKPVSCGTELNIVQEGLPDAIPVEACYLGWQDSLRNLASLVEPEISQ